MSIYHRGMGREVTNSVLGAGKEEMSLRWVSRRQVGIFKGKKRAMTFYAQEMACADSSMYFHQKFISIFLCSYYFLFLFVSHVPIFTNRPCIVRTLVSKIIKLNSEWLIYFLVHVIEKSKGKFQKQLNLWAKQCYYKLVSLPYLMQPCSILDSPRSSHSPKMAANNTLG